MELAIPIVLLGGLYVVSNQQKTQPQKRTKTEVSETSSTTKENFKNLGRDVNYLPNVNTIPSNYPVMNKKELTDNTNKYPNPNTATDKYFNQNAYETNQVNGASVGQNIQDIYSLSGNYLKTSEFKHNNMKPFYGAKIKGQLYNTNMAETMLDNMVGSGSQVIKKIEQAPLFKPEENVQWAFGTPNFSDFYQTRVVPGAKNNFVKPFESELVGPGLNQGYTTEGSNGFNAGMEARDHWLPKTVDELRIQTNPKQEFSLSGLQGPAEGYVKNLGSIGTVEKYRPDGFFINTQDRWLTTTGAEKLGQLLPKQEVNETNRSTHTKEYMGVASSGLKNFGYATSVYEPSKRTELANIDVPASVAVGQGPLEQQINKGINPRLQSNRSCNKQPDTFRSGFTSAIGAVVAPLMDILKPNRKTELCNQGVVVYGDPGSSVSSSYVINPYNSTKTTTKETTLYSSLGFIKNPTSSDYVNTNTPIETKRMETQCNDYMGPGIASTHGTMNQDMYYVQTNNDKKISTEYTNHGSTQIFNEFVNYDLKRNDNTATPKRTQAPANIVPSPPSVNTYGKVNVPQYYDECFNCTRIEPAILNQFRTNPYTFSLTQSA